MFAKALLKKAAERRKKKKSTRWLSWWAVIFSVDIDDH
jgi:hypothetical protein